MSESITLKKTLVAAAAAAVAGGAWAAELGSLMVFSAVGEPLQAQITIRDVDPKAEDLRVRLAPETTYRRVGKEVKLSLSDIKLTLVKKDPYTVAIKGAKAVDTDKFPLIVELSDAGKLSAKLYEVQLKTRAAVPAAQEKPAGEPAPQTAAPAPKPAAVPSASAVPSTRTAAAPKTPEPKYVPPVREPVQSEEPAAEVKKPVQKASRPAGTPAARTGAVRLPLNPADYDLDKPFVVREGMTMWSIATLYRPRYPKASMDQILVAFVRANPNAYEKGRVNGVKVGSTLTAPLADEVASVGLDEAWALVRVAPNADARKAPSRNVLERAQNRMKKASPALWRQWQAEQKKAAPAPKPAPDPETPAAVTAPAAAAAAAPAPAAAAPEPKAAPEEKAPAAADPLASTLAQAEAAHEAKVNAGEASAPQTETSAPAEPAKAEPEKTEPAAQGTPVPAMPAVTEEPQDGGSGGFLGWLAGILVVLAAAAGGAWYRMKSRAAGARRREENLGVVKFRKAESATNEQLQASKEMVERRLESERATERMQQPQKPAERIEPSLGGLKPQTPEKTPAPEAAEKPREGFNVASAYVGDEAKEAEPQPQAPAPVPAAEPQPEITSAELLAGKLITARTYIGVGAYPEAKRVLHEVMLAGTQEQRRQASELLAKISREDGTAS